MTETVALLQSARAAGKGTTANPTWAGAVPPQATGASAHHPSSTGAMGTTTTTPPLPLPPPAPATAQHPCGLLLVLIILLPKLVCLSRQQTRQTAPRLPSTFIDNKHHRGPDRLLLSLPPQSKGVKHRRWPLRLHRLRQRLQPRPLKSLLSHPTHQAPTTIQPIRRYPLLQALGQTRRLKRQRITLIANPRFRLRPLSTRHRRRLLGVDLDPFLIRGRAQPASTTTLARNPHVGLPIRNRWPVIVSPRRRRLVHLRHMPEIIPDANLLSTAQRAFPLLLALLPL